MRDLVKHVRWWIGAAIFLLCIFSGVALPAQTSYAVTLAELVPIEALVENNRLAEAADRLASVPEDGSDAAVYAAYLRARIAQHSGRLPEARNRYRAILAARPELTRVRLALAQTLHALEDFEGSRHNYELVLGTIGNDLADRSAADRIRNDLTALNNAKRWSAQLIFAVVPTSNLNNGTSSDVVLVGGIPFTPANAAKQKSGVALLYGGEFAYLHPVAEDIGMLASLSTTHFDASGITYDSRSVLGSLGPQVRIGTGTVTLEGVASRMWYGGAGYNTAYGGRVSGRFLLSNEWRMTGVATWTAQDYDTATYLNGKKVTASVSFDRFTLPGQFARIGVAFDQEKTATDFWTYSEYAALVGYYAELPYGVTVYPEVSYAARDYSGIFPFMTGPRQDRRWSASLSLTKRDLLIFGFAPRLIYTYTANYSNVGLYAYDKHSVISLLTRAF